MLAIKITTIRLQNAYMNSVYELGSRLIYTRSGSPGEVFTRHRREIALIARNKTTSFEEDKSITLG